VASKGTAPKLARLGGNVIGSNAPLMRSTSTESPFSASLDAQAQRSLQLALAAAQVAEDNRGQDVIILDLRDLTCIFDFFVIASGTSRRQLHAMSEEIDHKLEGDLGDKRIGIEGYDSSNWILLDYGTVVIHLFDTATRDFYAIEKLWGEARNVPWRELG
jgi:ribosome-associated protein